MKPVLDFVADDGAEIAVAEDRLEEFRADYPNARQILVFKDGDGDRRRVAEDRVEEFQRDVPGARRILKFKADDGQVHDVAEDRVDEFLSDMGAADGDPGQAVPVQEGAGVRSVGQIGKDLAGSFAVGAAGVPATLGATMEMAGEVGAKLNEKMGGSRAARAGLGMFAPGAAVLTDPTISGGLKEVGRTAKDWWSGEQERRRGALISDEGQGSDSVAWKIASGAVESSPQMIADYVTGGAGKLKLAGNAARTLISSAMEGNTSGAQARIQAEQSILNMPAGELAKLPGWDNYLEKAKGDVGRAREMAARGIGRRAYGATFLTTALTSLALDRMTGGTLDKWMQDPKVGKMMFRKMLGLMGSEAGEEAIQSGFETVVMNYSTGKPIMSGVWEAMGYGAATGALMAGAVSGVSAVSDRVGGGVVGPDGAVIEPPAVPVEPPAVPGEAGIEVPVVAGEVDESASMLPVAGSVEVVAPEQVEAEQAEIRRNEANAAMQAELDRLAEEERAAADSKIVQIPMPEKFADANEWIEFRESRLKNERDLFVEQIGLSEEEATRLQRVLLSDGDHLAYLDKLPPQKRDKGIAFFNGPFNSKESSIQFWEGDKSLNVEEVFSDEDPESLSMNIVTALRRGISNPNSDRFMVAVIAAKRMQELGHSKSDILKYIDKYTTRESGSQSSKVEMMKEISGKVNDFLRDQQIELQDGDLASNLPRQPVAVPVSPKAGEEAVVPDGVEPQAPEAAEEAAKEQLYAEADAEREEMKTAWPPIFKSIKESTGLSDSELVVFGLTPVIFHRSEVRNLENSILRNAPSGRLESFYNKIAQEGKTGRFLWAGTADEARIQFDPDTVGGSVDLDAAKKALEATNKVLKAIGSDRELPDFFKNWGNPKSKAKQNEAKPPELDGAPVDVAEIRAVVEKGEAPDAREWAIGELARAEKDGLIINNFPLDQLNLDPKRFQYKIVHGEKGATGSLEGVEKYDPVRGGVISVWRDPEDGRVYVVNGHNRVGKAKELGVAGHAVQFLRVQDAKEARAYGALINISEGRGSVLDAAKYFRDAGITREKVKAAGLPISEARVGRGLALARLNEKTFNEVVQGDMDEGLGVAIGEEFERHEDQAAFLKLIRSRNVKPSLKIIREVADDIKNAPAADGVRKGQMEMFPQSESEKRLIFERGRVRARINAMLSSDKVLFGKVGTKRAADRLGGAGNRIDPDTNAKISREAAAIQDVFNRLKNSDFGPILNRAAQDVAKGGKFDEVIKRVYGEIREGVGKALGREFEGGGAGGQENDQAGVVAAEVGGPGDKADRVRDGDLAAGAAGESALVAEIRMVADSKGDQFAGESLKALASRSMQSAAAKLLEDLRAGIIKEADAKVKWDEIKEISNRIVERAEDESARRGAGRQMDMFAVEAQPELPLTRGVGAAALRSEGEFMPKGMVAAENITGPRNAVADIERRVLGYPEYARPAARRFPELVDEAMQKMQYEPEYAVKLVEELNGVPRVVSDFDMAVLTIAKVQAFNGRNAAAELMGRMQAQNAGAAELDAARSAYAEAERRLERLFDAIAKSGTETGRALSARRLMMDEKFSLVELERSVRAAQGGAETSAAQRAEIARIKAEYDRTKAAQDKELARLSEEMKAKDAEIAAIKADTAFEDLVKAWHADLLKGARREKMMNWADRKEASIRERMRQRAGRVSLMVDPEWVADMVEMGAVYVVRGSYKFSDWANKIRSDFGKLTDGIDLKEIFARSATMANDLARQIKTEGAPDAGAPEGGPAGMPRTLAGAIKALYREQVENGETSLEAATEKVHAAVVGDNPGLTPENVRDLFSDYGKARKMSRTEFDRILAEMRRKAQLVASMERVANKLAPLKSGAQRDKPTQEIRDLTKQLKRMMREAGIEVVDPAKQLADTLSAVKSRLRNQIEDLNEAIDKRRRLVENKGTVPYDDEAKGLMAERDLLKKRYDAMFPREPLSDAQRLAIAIKGAERNLVDWSKKLDDAKGGKFGGRAEAKPLPASEILNDLRAKRDEAKAEVARLKELAFPKRSPEQVAIDSKRKRLLSGIAEMQRRMQSGDFDAKPSRVVDIAGDPAAMAAMAEHEKVKLEFGLMKENARRAKRTGWEVFSEGVLDVHHAQKSLLSSIDISAPFRQGGYVLLSNPVLWTKAWAPMLKSMSATKSAQINQAHMERNNARNGKYQEAGLVLAKADAFGNFTQLEDRYRLDLAEKVPILGKGVAPSNRAYGTFLNQIRVDLFDTLLANNPGADIKALAAGINEMTGRGNVGKSAEVYARYFWAPRFIKSAFDVGTLKPVRSGPRETKIIFAKQYARILGSLGVIYAARYLLSGKDDEPVNWDLTSPNWGGFKVGNYYLNPIGYARAPLVVLAKGIRTVSENWMGGEERDSGWTVPGSAGNTDYYATITGYLRGKLHPTYNTILAMINRREFGGQPYTGWSFVRSFLPLAPQQSLEIAQTEDLDKSVMLSVGAFVGADLKPDYQASKIMRNMAGSELEFFKKAGQIVYAGASPNATLDKIERTLKLISDMPYDDVEMALRAAVVARGQGDKAMNERVARLRSLAMRAQIMGQLPEKALNQKEIMKDKRNAVEDRAIESLIKNRPGRDL